MTTAVDYEQAGELKMGQVGIANLRIRTLDVARLGEEMRERVARAPNRSMYYAMGYEEGDFVKPMVGVANGHSTMNPCNAGIQPLVDQLPGRFAEKVDGVDVHQGALQSLPLRMIH